MTLSERDAANDNDDTDDAGLVNLRDCGGLPTEDGARTRSGVLWRSDAPYHGDPHPVGPDSWPPALVVDLRSVGELRGEDHPLVGLGSRLLHVPLMDALSPEVYLTDMVELYVQLIERCGPQLAGIVRAAATESGPVLVHCAAGKDRTGIVIGILLRAGGVTREAVVEDFLRSNDHLPHILRRLGIASERQPRHVVRHAAIDAVLDAVEGHPGGVTGWLAHHGTTQADLTTWHARIHP